MKPSAVFLLASGSLQQNRLRSGITISIIAFGIMALMGIITAIGAMNQKLMESFSTMGANGFTIRYKERNIHIGQRRGLEVEKKAARKEKQSKLAQPITGSEAEQFLTRFDYPAVSGIAAFAGNGHKVSYGGRSTAPSVYVAGGDQNYVALNGLELRYGRNLSTGEIRSGVAVCLLGADVAEKLFPGHAARALNQVVRINQQDYKVTGVLAARGSSFGFSRDNIVVTGYKSLGRNFSVRSFTIGVKTEDVNRVEAAMGEAEAKFRAIRKLAVSEESNFALDRSNSLAERALNSLRFLTISVTLIGIITLTGAAIGLMNILLVAVTERTREIGLVKALGGKGAAIRQQFFAESLLLSLTGALIGIGLGVVVGNLFAILLDTAFIIPWQWMIYGIIICTGVGLLAGIYPAVKAARLNPIEALRYE